MERYLSLVLDRDDNISLTLEKMEARELDIYISKNFNSSEEIREKYKHIIEPYLEQHKNYLASKTHKRGRIVITELQENLITEEKRVVYKKSLIIFHEITKIKKFIDILQDRDYIRSANNEEYKRIFSPDYGVEIKFHTQSPNKYNKVMGRWRNVIKDYTLYYDLIRRVLKEYEEIRLEPMYKDLQLPTLDAVYSEYLKEKKKNLEQRRINALEKDEDLEEILKEIYEQELLLQTEEPTRYKSGADEEEYPGDLERLDNSQSRIEKIDYAFENIPIQKNLNQVEEPIRYKSGADEEEYPGDLERLDNSQISTLELYEGISNGKTKTLNNGHHKLFDN